MRESFKAIILTIINILQTRYTCRARKHMETILVYIKLQTEKKIKMQNDFYFKFQGLTK